MQIAEFYERDGYVFPFRAFGPQRAAAYRAQLEHAERIAEGRTELHQKMLRG